MTIDSRLNSWKSLNFPQKSNSIHLRYQHQSLTIPVTRGRSLVKSLQRQNRQNFSIKLKVPNIVDRNRVSLVSEKIVC